MRYDSRFRSFPQSADLRHHRASPGIEALEVRSLLSTTAVLFQLPPGLATAAARGRVSTPALFGRMVGSLQAQIETQAPRDDAPQHLTDTVNEFVGQFET